MNRWPSKRLVPMPRSPLRPGRAPELRNSTTHKSSLRLALRAAPRLDEPIAANFAKADLDGADLVAADGPHLAEIVEPVLAQPREKIADSRGEQPRESAPSPQETTTADTSLAETPPHVAPSKEPLTIDVPSNDPPPSNSPTTESRLARCLRGQCNRPTCRRLKPTTVQPTRMPRSRIPWTRSRADCQRNSLDAAGRSVAPPGIVRARERVQPLGRAR